MGVAQGSLLGPLLFSLYINYLPWVCDTNVIMYADDTLLFTHGKNITEVAMRLTGELKKITAWLQNSCLTLNVEKTAVMYFTNRHKSLNYPDIYINRKQYNMSTILLT